MILGIGTDIVEIARIRAAWERNPEHFADTILSPEEKLLLEQRNSVEKKAEFLAGRWAAKEIGILPGTRGKPVLASLTGKAEKSASELGVTRVHISISHEKNHAVATVLLEGKEQQD